MEKDIKNSINYIINRWLSSYGITVSNFSIDNNNITIALIKTEDNKNSIDKKTIESHIEWVIRTKHPSIGNIKYEFDFSEDIH